MVDITRFVFATILHLQVMQGADVGLQMMKFASNHPFRFRTFRVCFYLGLAKFLIAIALEICNGMFITLRDTPGSILYDYIKMMTIAKLDDLVYSQFKDTPFAQMISASEDMQPIGLTI